MVVVDFLAAIGAWIYIWAGVNPSNSDFSLNVPAVAYDPGISVGDAGSGHPSLIAIVGQVGKVSAEEMDGIM